MSVKKVTMHGNSLTLTGELPTVGDKLPDFELVTPDLKPLRLADLLGKPFVLVVVPSLDTQVCSLEARRFDREMLPLQQQAAAVVVSMDLPFAQQRWANEAEVSHLLFGSDHRAADFGNAYGLLLPDLRLLTRAVLVADASGVLRHLELVEEITNEPDYGAALKALHDTLRAKN